MGPSAVDLGGSAICRPKKTKNIQNRTEQSAQEGDGHNCIKHAEHARGEQSHPQKITAAARATCTTDAIQKHIARPRFWGAYLPWRLGSLSILATSHCPDAHSLRPRNNPR